ncbi:MAG: AAA family ATPase [Candidatus Schekmanbacteria bacterium]|nr:AAA family ATPase [Candidatus Schekmanbacteria bacterium]
MYKSIKIDNFRCFEDIKIEPFKQVNLITGLNNAGKTSLLEALYLLMAPGDPEKLMVIMGTRLSPGIQIPIEMAKDLAWDNLFYNKAISEIITISTDNEKNKTNNLRIFLSKSESSIISKMDEKNKLTLFDVSERTQSNKIKYEFIDFKKNKSFSSAEFVYGKEPIYERANIKPTKGVLVSSHHRWEVKDADRFSNLTIQKNEEKLVDILKPIEPRLTRLAVITQGGIGIIHGDIGKQQLIPLPLMGGGMNRFLSLTLVLLENQGGVILIDEIDTGLHYEGLVNLWKTVLILAKEYNVQVFATTHSIECIRAAHQVFSETPDYDFTLHRMDINAEGKISSVYINQEALNTAIEMHMEIR